MVVLAIILVLFALGVTVVIVELRRAPRRAPTWGRGTRVVVMGALGGLMMVALSPSLALLEERDLPTARPPEPWRTPGEGCSDDGSGNLFVLVAVGFYIALRGGPAIAGVVGGAARRPGKPRREPDGRLALRIATASFAAIGGLATARLAACGAAPGDFTTYGAITPVGASGWRVDAALALTLDERRPIAEGAAIADELEHHAGSHMPPASSPYTSAAEGLQAWVDGQPILFHREDETERVVGSRVAHRDSATIPHERRPHFARWPEVARLDRDHLVIIGPASGGGTLAVKVSDFDVDAAAASYADAGLLVRPPLLPWLLAALLGAAGLALGRRGHRTDDARARMVGAWLLLEAVAVLIFGYLAAFGVAPG